MVGESVAKLRQRPTFRPLGESHQLLRLGRALLATGELSEAQQHCVEGPALDMPDTSYQAALALGIVSWHQRDPVAEETFAEAATRCWAMLDKTAGLYEVHYALAEDMVQAGGKETCVFRASLL